MPRHRPRPRPPWLGCWIAAALVILAVGRIPESWWAHWLAGRGPISADVSSSPDIAFEVIAWPTAPPPPVIRPQVGPEPVKPHPRLDDAAWWDRAWDVRIATDRDASRPATSVVDSLLFLTLPELALPTSVSAVIARPDSAAQYALWEMMAERAVDLSALRRLFHAQALWHAYQDLKSREAAMYDETPLETIMVPDPDRE